MAKYDDLNTPAVAVVGLLGTILTVAIILALVVVHDRVDARLEHAFATCPDGHLAKANMIDKVTLSSIPRN